MRLKIRTRLNSSNPDRDGELDMTPMEGPLVAAGDASLFASLASVPSVTADECVYCGDKGHRTKEHVIPNGWSGPLIIYEGSCDACQFKTQNFERAALRQGAMARVRMVRGTKSYSKHRGVPKAIDVTFVKDGQPVIETIATTSVPLVLGFPLFSLPSLLSGGDQKQLNLIGTATTIFGPDPDQFLKEHGATKMIAKEEHVNPTPFARTMAKIAYCFAWVDGVLEFVDGHTDLVHAFMDEPDLLGTFVGTKPAPFQQFQGRGFRVQYLADDLRFPIMEVQPFSDTPAPTYLVALGTYRGIRARRQFRARLSERYPKKNNTPPS